MKSYPRALIGLFLVLFLAAPSLLVSQQLYAPMERTVLPNVPTSLEYAGQTLTFSSTVGLLVKFKMVGFDQFELTIEQHGPPAGGQGASSEQNTQIYWEDYNDVIYDDLPPNEPWTGLLLTEGGWTEK